MPDPSTRKPITLIALRHSGTHLIQPIIRHLTGKTVYAPKGMEALTCVPSAKCVVFLRDPRNTICSWARYKNDGAEMAKMDRRIAKLLTKQKRGEMMPIPYMTEWAKRWCHRPPEGSCIIWFQDLTGDRERVVTLIRDYLGMGGDVDAAIAYAFGTSGTYTGNHSKWKDWFGPEATKVWNENGGPELARLMGYE